MSVADDPSEALRTFLDDMDTSVHIIQQGAATWILTKMDRDALVDYLNRLTEELVGKIDSDDGDDLVLMKEVKLPTGDRLWGVILREPVF